jgi:predicted RNA binding protein YcfA (HicA-like mRNA interferase family)
MTRLTPVSRVELRRRLRSLGFEGPFVGGHRSLMARSDLRLIVPNLHHGDISADLLARIIRQAGVSREAWYNTARIRARK